MSTQQPYTQPAPQKEDGVTVFLMWFVRMIFSPFAALGYDSPANIHERLRKGEYDVDQQKALSFGQYVVFPAALFAACLFGAEHIPFWAVLAIGSLTVFGVMRRGASKDDVSFSLKQIVAEIKRAKAFAIGTVVVVAAAALFTTFVDQSPLGAWAAVMAAYPLAYTLGRRRVRTVLDHQDAQAQYRRTLALGFGTTEETLTDLKVWSTGSYEERTFRIHTGILPTSTAMKLDGLVAGVEARTPDFEVIDASPNGVILGLATEETLRRREMAKASGGTVNAN